MNYLSVIFSVLALAISIFGTAVVNRDATARALLTEALDIWSQQEAWILDGNGYEGGQLSKTRDLELATEKSGQGFWLRPVEVRAITDQSPWNASPDSHFYKFIGKRRTWIVRDQLLESAPSYPVRYIGHYRDVQPHPAIISSKAQADLTAWVERVANGRKWWIISDQGLEMLKPYLEPLSGEDRIALFGPLLSAETKRFLQSLRTRWPN